MKAVFLRQAALLLALPLAACASVGGGGGTAMGPEVTRFHLGQPVARGQISVEAFDPADANAPEFRSYAASVASELSRLGMVSFDAWRACRLVVDTGMHHFGWSRDRAIAYMRDNTALTETNISNEVDRYIAWPGQALAYMIGRLRIQRLREQVRAAKGPAFDIRAFHHEVLAHGPLPLDLLDELVAGG